MYVCICKAVTDRQVREAIQHGARTAAELREGLQIMTGCGRCASRARELLREELQASEADSGLSAA